MKLLEISVQKTLKTTAVSCFVAVNELNYLLAFYWPYVKKPCRISFFLSRGVPNSPALFVCQLSETSNIIPKHKEDQNVKSQVKRKIDDDGEIVSFSARETDALDEYFRGSNAETAYLLGRYCGLRINECYGLKWSNVDFDNDCIHIEHQMQYESGLITLSPLKTKNAKRTLYMNSKLKSYLLALKQSVDEADKTNTKVRTQNQTMITDADGTSLSSLLLVNSLLNGKIQTVNSMKYHSKKIKETLKINFKYHYLRHTYGTRLAEQNMPAHLLCDQMGHANSKVTERYYLAVSKQGAEIIKEKIEGI